MNYTSKKGSKKKSLKSQDIWGAGREKIQDVEYGCFIRIIKGQKMNVSEKTPKTQ